MASAANPAGKGTGAIRRASAILLALPLAGFFAFVGWNKAFASLADLARYGSWTVHLPAWLGRIIGVSEMALATGLAGAVRARWWRAARISALALVVNQLVAAAIHAAAGEDHALPQNAVLIALLVAVALLTGKSRIAPSAKPSPIEGTER